LGDDALVGWRERKSQSESYTTQPLSSKGAASDLYNLLTQDDHLSRNPTSFLSFSYGNALRRKMSCVKYYESYDGNWFEEKSHSVRTRRCDFMRTRIKESKVPLTLKGRADRSY